MCNFHSENEQYDSLVMENPAFANKNYRNINEQRAVRLGPNCTTLLFSLTTSVYRGSEIESKEFLRCPDDEWEMAKHT